MKNWFKDNIWQIAIVGVGGFMCTQMYQLRAELSAFRGGTESKLESIDKRLGNIETKSESAFERFNEKHSILSNKFTALEAKVSASFNK